MKIKQPAIFLLLTLSLNTFANNKCEKNPFEDLESITKQVQGCPPPNYDEFCNDITLLTDPTKSNFGSMLEERLWEASCANINSLDQKKERIKIQEMWSKYKLKFKCDFTEANILKYLINKGLIDLVDMMGRKDDPENYNTGYDLDINFIDPVDNLNVLDYVNKEIKRKDDSAGMVNHYSTKLLRDYRYKLIRAGAKPSK